MFPAMNKVEQLAVELLLLTEQPLFSRLTELGAMVKAGDLTLNEYTEIYMRVSQHLEDQGDALHFEDSADEEIFE